MEPDPELNPHKNAWITKDTLVASEAEGARDWNWNTGRYWKVTNPSKKNELGSPVAYKLVPREIVPVMVQEGSYIYDRAKFVQHNLWVTKYDPAEKFAAGDYMYQSADAQGGLPEFVADDAPLDDTDVVLWYTLGAHHIVRPEDWPVMPCAYVGFHLKPIGFFDGNPRAGPAAVTAEGVPRPSLRQPAADQRDLRAARIVRNSRRCSGGQVDHQPLLGRAYAGVGALQQLHTRAGQLRGQRASRCHGVRAGDQPAFLQAAQDHVHRLRRDSGVAGQFGVRAVGGEAGQDPHADVLREREAGWFEGGGAHFGAQRGGHSVQQVAQRLVVTCTHVKYIDIYQLR